MSSILAKIGKRFRRGHPDIFQAVRAYAQSKGLDPEDVVAAATSAYLSTDEEGRDKLETAISERKASGGSGSEEAGLEKALAMFERMVDTSVKLMTKSQEAGQQLIKGSLLNELKTQAQTIEEIKSIGASGGKGSIEDRLAGAFVDGVLRNVGASMGGSGSDKTKTKVTSGKGAVEKVSEAT